VTLLRLCGLRNSSAILATVKKFLIGIDIDIKCKGFRKQEAQLVPANVHSTAEGQRGLISQHVHYQLVRGNRWDNFHIAPPTPKIW